MKPVRLKIKNNPLHLVKETKEQRLERLKYSKAIQTKVVPDKKNIYNRNKIKSLGHKSRDF